MDRYADDTPNPPPRRRAAGAGAEMKKAAYSLAPIQLGKDAWFYESRYGIVVVAEKRDAAGIYTGTTMTRISWAKLAKSLAKHQKIVRQRRAK